MAITRYCYQFWKELRDEGRIPAEPYVLELGQANWYGDLDAFCLLKDIREYAESQSIHLLVERLGYPDLKNDLFRQAEIFYAAILQYAGITAIDMNGTSRALRLDLNYPVIDRFANIDLSVVINTGTAEHIFNQHQFFKTAHDACAREGIMVHMLPAWGWLDHGFYNYHPTFVADLAAANGYEIVKWWMYDLGASRCFPVRTTKDAHDVARIHGMTGSMMHAVCYRKVNDVPFQMPFQGHYAGTLEPELEKAWFQER